MHTAFQFPIHLRYRHLLSATGPLRRWYSVERQVKENEELGTYFFVAVALSWPSISSSETTSSSPSSALPVVASNACGAIYPIPATASTPGPTLRSLTLILDLASGFGDARLEELGGFNELAPSSSSDSTILLLLDIDPDYEEKPEESIKSCMQRARTCHSSRRRFLPLCDFCGICQHFALTNVNYESLWGRSGLFSSAGGCSLVASTW